MSASLVSHFNSLHACMLGNFVAFLLIADFFKDNFKKKSSMNDISDPDQGKHSVGPNLDPN